MTTTNFGGLSKTQRGRAEQIRRGYLGLADEMKRKQVIDVDCDQPQTLEQALRVIVSLQNKLAELESLREADRAAAYSDVPAAMTDTMQYDTTLVVAKRSGKSVSTICRNADLLQGFQLKSGDWLFPAGTTYGGKRKRKAK